MSILPKKNKHTICLTSILAFLKSPSQHIYLIKRFRI